MSTEHLELHHSHACCWPSYPAARAVRRRRGVVAAGGVGGVVLRSGGIGLVWRAASRTRESSVRGLTRVIALRIC
jgi:hypothetical protein